MNHRFCGFHCHTSQDVRLPRRKTHSWSSFDRLWRNSNIRTVMSSLKDSWLCQPGDTNAFLEWNSINNFIPLLLTGVDYRFGTRIPRRPIYERPKSSVPCPSLDSRIKLVPARLTSTNLWKVASLMASFVPRSCSNIQLSFSKLQQMIFLIFFRCNGNLRNICWALVSQNNPLRRGLL